MNLHRVLRGEVRGGLQSRGALARESFTSQPIHGTRRKREIVKVDPDVHAAKEVLAKIHLKL